MRSLAEKPESCDVIQGADFRNSCLVLTENPFSDYAGGLIMKIIVYTISESSLL